jgi:hypothetical protein
VLLFTDEQTGDQQNQRDEEFCGQHSVHLSWKAI